MKLSSVIAGAHLAALGMAADQSEVDFLTALVSDYNDHKTEYFNFIRTATGYPPDLTRLAVEIRTYTDDSYTTLLDDGGLNGDSLMSYATNLPWYSRVAAAAGEDSGSGSGSSGSSASSGSSSASSGSSSSSSPSLTGGSGKYVAPAGALVGAAAILLL